MKGLGIAAGTDVRHFVVEIPGDQETAVFISERYSGGDPGDLRVILSLSKWDAIAQRVTAEFNQRLDEGDRGGTWHTGDNYVRADFGKELVLLAWAIEDAEAGLIPVALANWGGLAPEERWWLYTQTAAATGGAVLGRGRGWRKAVRFALTENPILV